jgi:hypothetical protein
VAGRKSSVLMHSILDDSKFQTGSLCGSRNAKSTCFNRRRISGPTAKSLASPAFTLVRGEKGNLKGGTGGTLSPAVPLTF